MGVLPNGPLRVVAVYYPSDGSTYSENLAEDSINIIAKRASESKSNTLSIELKNPFGKWAGSNGPIFSLDERIDLYVRYDYDNTGCPLTNDNLLFIGRVLEVEAVSDEKKTSLKVELADNTFVLLNRLWVSDYQNVTVPYVIKNVINHVSELGDGTYRVGADFESSGGYIQDTRPDGSSFPNTSVAKVFKPVYEWITDLSQPDFTNSATELANAELANSTVPCPKAFKFYLDTNSAFHWFYPNDTAQHILTVGITSSQSSQYTKEDGTTVTVNDANPHMIKSMKMTRKVFDIVNFIIYKAGEDMDGVQIMDFHFDETSGSPILKDSFRNFEDIGRSLKTTDASQGKIAKITGDDYDYPTVYPMVPSWDPLGRSVADDGEYNDNFISVAKSQARGRCESIFRKTGNPRWKGTIELLGENTFDVGELALVNLPNHGITNIPLRIVGLTHTIRPQSGWFVTLEVEEDEALSR